MSEPELAVVFSPREWANRLVRYVTDHGGGRVRLRVVEGRVALEEDFDVLIAEDITSFLNPRLVQELQKRGRRILGVYDPEEATGRQRLIGMGVDDVIETAATSEELVRRIGSLTRQAESPLDTRFQEIAAHLSPGMAMSEETRATEGAGRTSRGLITAVGGPPGGCGATEVAIEMARGLRRRGETVVVMDADEAFPAIAQRLGLPLVPNIRTAVDALFHSTGEVSEALMAVAGGGYEVLAGLANPGDWSQLRPFEVTEVARELAGLRDHVIVNVGREMEDVTRFGGPDRFGITRAMIEEADVVVGVGAASPVGVARLLSWIAEAAPVAAARPIHVVVNKAPVSKFIRAELDHEIRRTYAMASLHFVPFDAAVETAAWRGEVVAAGPFVKAVAEMLLQVAPKMEASRAQRDGRRSKARGPRRVR
ncbi:MAG: AAA family ATPase [Actinomycetota bacterium]